MLQASLVLRKDSGAEGTVAQMPWLPKSPHLSAEE